MLSDNTPSPRSNIPEDWLIGMTCPVCGDTHLVIEREVSQPDLMSCHSCMALFEMSQDGGLIRLVRAPSSLPPNLANQWVKPASVGRLAYEHAQKTEPVASFVEDLTLEERVIALTRLHNSPDKVRQVLSRLPGVTTEQIDAAIAKVNPEKGKNNSAWTFILGIGVVILAVAIGVVLLTTPGQGGQEAAAPSAQATATSVNFLNPANLPAPLQTLLPPGVKILQPTPATVRQLNPVTEATTRCPVTPGEAAQTFGGEMKEWTKSTQGGTGWSLISLTPRSIKVPKNMTAGYFVMGSSPAMESVIGPAVIDNVNFVSVSCE